MNTKLLAVITASAFVSLKQAYRTILFVIIFIAAMGWFFYQLGRGIRYAFELKNAESTEVSNEPATSLTAVDVESVDCVSDTADDEPTNESTNTSADGCESTNECESTVEHTHTKGGNQVTTVRTSTRSHNVTREQVDATRKALHNLEVKTDS